MRCGIDIPHLVSLLKYSKSEHDKYVRLERQELDLIIRELRSIRGGSMSATEQMPPKTLPCVTIGVDDAKKLRARVHAMKRAALNIELNARQFANEADKLTDLLDLIIEPSAPCS